MCARARVFNAKIQTVDTGKARVEKLEQKWRQKTLEASLDCRRCELWVLAFCSRAAGNLALGQGRVGTGSQPLLVAPRGPAGSHLEQRGLH